MPAEDPPALDWRSRVLEVRKDRRWDLAFYSRAAPVYELWAALAKSRALAEVRRVLRPGGRLIASGMTKAQRLQHRFWDALYARGLTSPRCSCRRRSSALATPLRAASADLDRDEVRAGSGELRVPRQKRAFERFCQGDVGRVVGGDVVAELKRPTS